MMRITVLSHSPQQVLLKVEGWIDQPHIPLLETELQRWLEQTATLVVDVAQVRSIDQAGLKLLRRFAHRPVRLVNGSPYVRQLLQSHGLL